MSLNAPILRELHLLALHCCGMWAIRLLGGSFVLPDDSHFEGQSPYVFGFAAQLGLRWIWTSLIPWCAVCLVCFGHEREQGCPELFSGRSYWEKRG